MPFYQTEDITCFIYTAITEYIEEIYTEKCDDGKESYQRIKDILAKRNMYELKILCEEHIEMCCNSGCDSPFFAAVLNSINLENLHTYLAEWIETEFEWAEETDKKSEDSC